MEIVSFIQHFVFVNFNQENGKLPVTFKWEMKLLPRTRTSLSFDENLRAKKGGKEKKGDHLSCFSFPWSIAIRHQSLAFRVRLYVEKYEAPEMRKISAHHLI